MRNPLFILKPDDTHFANYFLRLIWNALWEPDIQLYVGKKMLNQTEQIKTERKCTSATSKEEKEAKEKAESKHKYNGR